MQSLTSFVVRLAREEDGAAASEYAILVAFIVAAVAAAVALFDIQGIFTTVSNNIKTLIAGAPAA